MENSNSREYLEKITAAVVDNLRQTGPAPSVQMQDVPRKPFGGMTDEEEAELDDLDEDENKDTRMTEHRWDKRVQHDAEYEASDDEDMSRANGATRLKTNKRTFTDFRKGETDVESDHATPRETKSNDNGKEQADDDTHDVNDDTIEDIGATQEADKQSAKDDEPPQPEKEQVDEDGDVGMTDPASVEEAPIKKEEVEPETSSEPKPVEKPAEEKPVGVEPPEPAAEKTPAPEPKQAETEPERPTEAPAEAPEAKADDAPVTEAMEVDEEKEKAKDEKEPSIAR